MNRLLGILFIVSFLFNFIIGIGVFIGSYDFSITSSNPTKENNNSNSNSISNPPKVSSYENCSDSVFETLPTDTVFSNYSDDSLQERFILEDNTLSVLLVEKENDIYLICKVPILLDVSSTVVGKEAFTLNNIISYIPKYSILTLVAEQETSPFSPSVYIIEADDLLSLDVENVELSIGDGSIGISRSINFYIPGGEYLYFVYTPHINIGCTPEEIECIESLDDLMTETLTKGDIYVLRSDGEIRKIDITNKNLYSEIEFVDDVEVGEKNLLLRSGESLLTTVEGYSIEALFGN